MIIANIEPIMKEIQEAKDKSLFDEDICMCYVLSVLEKAIRDTAKVEIDIKSIEARFEDKVVQEPLDFDALNNCEEIYFEMINSMKKLEDPA